MMGLKNEDVKKPQSTGDEEYHIDMSYLLEQSYERTINDKIAAIFGGVLRRGKDIREKISEQLYEALDADKISKHELKLWGGRVHPSKLDVLLVIEALWRAELNDIERAVTRANILRKIEINALPVVAGRLWDNQMIDSALHAVIPLGV